MDEADITDRNEAVLTDSTVAGIRYAAANIPEGQPGECDLCGEPSLRLVKGNCARCRDKYRLQ